MKKKLLPIILSIALAIVLSFTNTGVLKASPLSVVDLSFATNSAVDVDGSTWGTGSGSTPIAGGRLNLDNGAYQVTSNNNGIPGFMNALNNNTDFYTKALVNFHAFQSTSKIINYSGSNEDYVVTYNDTLKKLEVWLTDAVTHTTTTISFNANLSIGVDYNIVVSRNGSNLIAYVNDVSLGSQPITIATYGSTSETFYLGGATIISHIEVASLKVVTGDFYHAPTSQDTAVAITGGNLNVNPATITFTSATIDNTVAQTVTSNSSLAVIDNRGSDAGWAVKVSATDLVSSSVSDPSSGGTGNLVVSMPASVIAVVPGSLTTNAGQAIDSTYGPIKSNVTLDTSQKTLINTSPGYGAGSYTIPLAYTITLQKTASIVSQSGTGSKYVVGNAIGLLAGTYTTTVTYTSGVGL